MWNEAASKRSRVAAFQQVCVRCPAPRGVKAADDYASRLALI
jgi:hypothetical protein